MNDHLKDVMAAHATQFTRAERQLQAVLLADYPYAALSPIQELSERSSISAPSISRFVSKLGYHGFSDFQQHALKELRNAQPSPVQLKNSQPASGDDPMTQHFNRSVELTQQFAERLPREQFDRIVDLLGDPSRRIYVIGGRMSDALGGFFLNHLRQIRGDTFHIPQNPEVWPEYLLRLRPRDVVMIFDFRRYDPRLKSFSEAARARKAQCIVVTDTWISPAAKGAQELICVPTDSGTLWDSYVAAYALMEALLVPLAERDWDRTKARIEAWDGLRVSPPAEVSA